MRGACERLQEEEHRAVDQPFSSLRSLVWGGHVEKEPFNSTNWPAREASCAVPNERKE